MVFNSLIFVYIFNSYFSYISCIGLKIMFIFVYIFNGFGNILFNGRFSFLFSIVLNCF